MGKTMTIRLHYPYTTAAGQYISEVEIRRPKVEDLRKIPKKTDKLSRKIHLLSNLVGLIPEDLDYMDQLDFINLQKLYKKQQLDDYYGN